MLETSYQSDEWNANSEVSWWLLEAGPYHQGLQRFVQDLNRLYVAEPALWQADYDHSGFYWIDCSDSDNSVLSFVRQDRECRLQLVVVMNLTPVVRYRYRVGLPKAGRWREVLNSDAATYGGSKPSGTWGESAPRTISGTTCRIRPR